MDVVPVPRINSRITGSGVIEGQFTDDEAEALAVQMRYGALPVPLKVVDIRTVGASLAFCATQHNCRYRGHHLCTSLHDRTLPHARADRRSGFALLT